MKPNRHLRLLTFALLEVGALIRTRTLTSLCRLALAGAATLVLWPGQTCAATSIGVSFGFGSTSDSLSPTASAGVAPYAQTHYNNVTSNSTNLVLNDNTGTATTGMLTIANARFGVITNLSAGADEMFNDGEAYQKGSVSFSLTNIPYASYSLVVYDLFDLSGGVQGITLGSTTYYTLSPDPSSAGYIDNNANTAFTYTPGTGTSQATATVGADYVVFTGLSGSSLSVTLSNPSDIGEVGGFQIIQNVPEPSTRALLCLSVMGLLGLSLRQRRRALIGATVILLAASPEGAHAQVTFTRSGSDLLLSITSPINFTSTVTHTDTDFFGVDFPNVYRDEQLTEVFLLSPQVPVTIDGVTDSRSYLAQGVDGGVNTDRDILFNLQGYSTAVTITPGKTLTVPAGIYTATGYFTDSESTLPDLPATSAYFFYRGGNQASNTVNLVPEPGASLPLAVGMGLIVAVNIFKRGRGFPAFGRGVRRRLRSKLSFG